MISEIPHSVTGSEIHPEPNWPPFSHRSHHRMVIGETAIIGRHVRLYQAVTRGRNVFRWMGRAYC
ncbi:hypothetical protein [Nitrosospira multiformis]|uniref:hypothetical protein n=1 Tax=Nitrosospira multiformis TaxID=1231 RepID=UPI0021562E9C|nr:hypothetical protein [Nitrosospira multiformis]